MAKPENDTAHDPVHASADDLAASHPEGSRARLLADEDGFDRRTPWRLAGWGLSAVGAVTVAVLVHQFQIHTRLDRAAVADLTQRSEQIQAIARESRNDIRRLAAAIDTLNSDRDRLFARATALEQGLESVTGSIARQHAASSPPAAAPPPPAAAPDVKSETADTAPEITAAIPAEPTPAATEVAVPRTAFAVDLGAAHSIDGLRSLWRRLTAAHRTVLVNLTPAIALEERKAPAGVQLRLIAGPLDNAARAAAICAALAARHQSCATTTFAGPKLTMDAEPAAAPPPPPRRPAPHLAVRAKSTAAPPPARAPSTPSPAPSPSR